MVLDLILGVLCEVRSTAHSDQHGGVWADSAWHVAQGELPTCNGILQSDSKSKSDDNSDDDWGRDEFGWNCTWRGCG